MVIWNPDIGRDFVNTAIRKFDPYRGEPLVRRVLDSLIRLFDGHCFLSGTGFSIA
jgi:hypothetical protein